MKNFRLHRQFQKEKTVQYRPVTAHPPTHARAVALGPRLPPWSQLGWSGLGLEIGLHHSSTLLLPTPFGGNASLPQPSILFAAQRIGVGKTTLVQKACSDLKEENVPVQGFYTEEVRTAGQRVGFDVVTICGTRAPLARVHTDDGPAGNMGRQPRVGQYHVQLQPFELTALPTLRLPKASSGEWPVLIIDEVGKMEVFSNSFVHAVRSLLTHPHTAVLATIPLAKGRPIPLVEELRSSKQARVFEISKGNRDSILPDIISALQLARKIHSQS